MSGSVLVSLTIILGGGGGEALVYLDVQSLTPQLKLIYIFFNKIRGDFTHTQQYSFDVDPSKHCQVHIIFHVRQSLF